MSIQLPNSTQCLPLEGRRIFKKFYIRGLEMTRSNTAATRIAWMAVKRKYVQIDDRWVPRADANEHDTTTDDDTTTTDEETTTSTTSSDDDDYTTV
ncbi:chaB [Malacosoma neustria nucleopolyhedrovirus]|uniref:chaB n=1 Tax=Malacosoma neustria nuclear polyhedrosis virus TaxID=38012 RepID=UPI000E35ECD1|nr:chaB [Malacosoma neustria nucleopolyhedrovirus]AUF81574.1 chaB [Malacosoma neustria nucleopolyhedrovirus]